MRRSTFVVLFVFALVVTPALLAGTSAPEVGLEGSVIATSPSKICNPKKPITCRAAEFPAMQALAETTLKDSMGQWMTPKVEPTTPKTGLDNGLICCPPRWLCKSPVG
jgi:hypothetical protein